MANYLTADKTVNFTAVDTAATIQAAIDAEPKNLNGYILTFQFADGTYTLNATISIKDFFGGEVYVQGNVAENENSLHTNQAVILDNTSGNVLFSISNISVLYLYNLKISTTLKGFALLKIKAFEVKGLYITSSTTTGNIIDVFFSMGLIGFTYFTQGAASILSNMSSLLYSETNASTGTTSLYGLISDSASVIGKKVGSQPTGSIQNELAQNGGVIR